ncbi:hypothetical protein Tco_0516475 [Tanacetum coccineum]
MGIILVSPEERMHSYAIRLKFNTSDHAIDCEALLAGLTVSVSKEGNHTPATEQEKKYKKEIMDATALFHKFQLTHLPKILNSKAEVLTGLATIKLEFLNQEKIHEDDLEAMDFEGGIYSLLRMSAKGELFRDLKLNLSYSGLDEFKEPEFKAYGSEVSEQESNVVSDKKSDDSKENSDESLVKEQVSKDTSSFVESSLNVDKETVFPVDKKVEIVKPKNHEKPVKKSVRYAEMYRSQTPMGNQRN